MRIIKDTIDDIRDDLDNLKSDREMIKSNYNTNDIIIEQQPKSYREIKNNQFDELLKDSDRRGMKDNSAYNNYNKNSQKIEQKTFEKRLKNKSFFNKRRYKDEQSSARNNSCPDKGEELKLNFQYRAREYSFDKNKEKTKKLANPPGLPPVSANTKDTTYLVN